MSSLQVYSVLVLMNLIQVNMIGINYEDDHIATGLGNHLARPILRDEWHENLSFEEGVKLLEKCMRVLLYRDRSAVNKIQVCFSLFLHHLTYPNSGSSIA
jgi:20S proteasome alpha/beta subunit